MRAAVSGMEPTARSSALMMEVMRLASFSLIGATEPSEQKDPRVHSMQRVGGAGGFKGGAGGGSDGGGGGVGSLHAARARSARRSPKV